MTTKRDKNDTAYMLNTLQSVGITHDDALSLRRIAMTLHSWHERECGTEYGAIERDDVTGKTYWRSAFTVNRYTTPDREKGALKRLAKIMSRYPTLTSYIQQDPRGAPLYILRQGDIPEGKDVDAYYSRGLAVYR